MADEGGPQVGNLMLTIAFYQYDDISVNDDRQKNNDIPDSNDTGDSETTGLELTLDPNAELIRLQAVDETLSDEDSILDSYFNDINGYLGRDTDQKLAEPLTANGVTYSAGSLIGTDFGFEMSYEEDGVTKSLWIYSVEVRTGSDGDETFTNIGYVTTEPLKPGITYTSTGKFIGQDIEVPYTNLVPCFAAGTMIDTPRGPVAVESIAVGDMVLTRDSGPQPVRWTGSRSLDAGSLGRNETLRPVRIKAGALGDGLPASDLLVSPQHRILVRSRIAQRIFGTDEILVAAKQLCQLDGIDIADDVTEVTYVHLLFDRHEIVVSNGA